MRSLAPEDLPLSLRERYYKYSFLATDPNGAFAYDTIPQWEEMTSQVQQRLWDALQPLRGRDPRLYAQELEFLEKMGVCWRSRGMGTLFVADPSTLSLQEPDQAAALRPELRVLGQKMAAALRAIPSSELLDWYNGAVVRLDRGKGSPYWLPGTDTEGGIATARVVRDARTFKEIERRINDAGDGTMGLIQTSDIRIQSARGRQPNYIVIDGEIEESGTRYAPKIRRIAAQPSATNYFWVPFANCMREVVARLPGNRNTGTVEPVIRSALKRKYSVAVDLKTYDLTVGVDLLDAWREEVAIPCGVSLVNRGVMQKFELERILDIDYNTQRMPVLLPPRNMREAGWIAQSIGELRSGENPTSLKGTTINRCRCNVKLREVGGSEIKTDVFNYGDDTIIQTDDARIIDKWIEKAEFLGFKEEAAPDSTFLMKRVPYGYGYIGRMLMACIDREPKHEPSSTVAAAAAFATRYALLEGHPLKPLFYDILDVGGSPQRYKDAIAIARNVANPVDFSYASNLVRESRAGGQMQDAIDSLESLSFSPVIDPTLRQAAIIGARKLGALQIAQRKRLRWAEFQRVRDELTETEAIALINARSYKTRSTR